MSRKRNLKRVYLVNGSEEGFGWHLILDVYKNTKVFSGDFTLGKELDKRRALVRGHDRHFFELRLGGKYMADKVLHHDWIGNSAKYIKVVLLHKSEHPNGGKNVLRDRKVWIEKEVWLNEEDESDET